MTVAFTVLGEPQGKGRPRFGGGRVYTPAKTVAYERLIAQHAAIAMRGKELLLGPVAVSIVAIFGIPSSWSIRRKAANAEAPEYVQKKPDFDNTCKVLCDPLNGLVWRDDAQVSDARIIRLYGTEPALHITITELPERAVRLT